MGGHSYNEHNPNGPAAFNPLADVPVDGLAIFTNAKGETWAYKKVLVQDFDGVYKDELEIPKATQKTDTRLYPEEWIEGCLMMVTCLSDGEYDATGHALALRVARFMRVPLPEQPLTAYELRLLEGRIS